jgi:3-dehydro-scyllo-inosose hydrolase
LGEDTFLVTRMAEQVALKTGCTVAEPVWYGSHPYNHLGMPGTVVVPEDAFLANLRAIIAGLWNTGFRKQILLNGHGQEEVIPLALHQWAKKYQVPCILISLHWPTVIHDYLRDKAHGGPFDTPFQHADEAEASYSLALFPELMDMQFAVDNKPEGFLPAGHVDKGGEVYHSPIKGHEHVGLSGTEVLVYPEGVIGSPTLASADKAMKGLNVLLDYMCKLIDDIMTRFPAGQLPPASKTTMRDPKEIEALLKGPFKGGKHLYTIAYPP